MYLGASLRWSTTRVYPPPTSRVLCSEYTWLHVLRLYFLLHWKRLRARVLVARFIFCMLLDRSYDAFNRANYPLSAN
jgi:hypothetical protein